ncbi:alkaline phosphatase [Desulfatitalea alkaliphila]|uniref:Alkaline phosphatase n=1 Tax=Desulfatitalea alkaliphila TaxID=2929485 RepID=A0AA41UIM8_9BACT|nr:alkaline phosphatase [Desulfatitalea alkaliphila]MCJ8500264.1 alkaline phosphatase [Desulfatitalea alkaliphila]
MVKGRKLTCIMLLILALLFSAASAAADQPKYVFFFLGDGMANAQIQATEAYLTTINGGSAEVAEDLLRRDNRLNMSRMAVQGMQTTYDAFALMTDSASSATAFAGGIKTRSAVIGMDHSLTRSFKSVAQLAREQGKKVGVISSVPLNHATPAAYYASVTNRGLYNSIATQMAESGYEFFGGGGILSPTGAARDGDTGNDIWALLAENGYEVLNDRETILNLQNDPRDMVLAINPFLQDSQAMPYAIDKPAENLSLAEMTEVAIAVLSAKEKPGRGPKGPEHWKHPKKFKHPRNDGFFLMVEGGKIDWACHANDAMAVIGDMLDFDDAVGVALAFQRRYPRETLIIVTGDHETGGMTIGHATTAYRAYYERLLDQKHSFTHFGQNQWPAHKAAQGEGYDWTNPANLAGSAEMIALMADAFGLRWDELNEYEQERLEDAYDMSMVRRNKNSGPKNAVLYGYYEPIIVTITHVLNERASIGWTSYAHTGVPVPLYAQGPGAERFAGFYDNTDIAKKIARVLNVRQALPIEK